MSNVLFQVGPFHITLLGVFSLLGLIAGLVVFRHEAHRKGIPGNVIENTALVTLLSALVGARLYFALVFAQGGFLASARQFLAFNQGGLSIQGALIGGMLGAVVYLWHRAPGFWRTADAAAPTIILGQAIGRVGCDVFGVQAPEYARWAVSVGGQMLHPVQLYESMLNYLLFMLIWFLRGRTRRDGELFLVYIAGFAFNRFVVEFFRTNPSAVASLSVAHVTALAMATIALSVLILRQRWAAADARNSDVATLDSRLIRSDRLASGASPYFLVPLLMVGSIFTYYAIYW